MCRNMPFVYKTIVKSPSKRSMTTEYYFFFVFQFVMMTEPCFLLRADHKHCVAHILSSTQFYDELQ